MLHFGPCSNPFFNLYVPNSSQSFAGTYFNYLDIKLWSSLFLWIDQKSICYAIFISKWYREKISTSIKTINMVSFALSQLWDKDQMRHRFWIQSLGKKVQECSVKKSIWNQSSKNVEPGKKWVSVFQNRFKILAFFFSIKRKINFKREFHCITVKKKKG